ncbi:hypothetical protein ABH917_001484 [Thermobifida halotolerans]
MFTRSNRGACSFHRSRPACSSSARVDGQENWVTDARPSRISREV